MKKHLLLSLFILNYTLVFSQKINLEKQSYTINENVSYLYKKPKFKEIFKYVPKDILHFGKYLIQKENLPIVAATLGSTLAIIPIDQKLTDNASEFGHKFNFDNEGDYLRIADLRIAPANIPAAVYYLGNGGTSLMLSGGFFLFGQLNQDYRALNTSQEILEVMMSGGAVVQFIKRSTGRQSPVVAIETGNPGGHWTPFPSFASYLKDTPKYDAMPSGHLATFMGTVTVILTNYPEKKWLKPVGYSLVGLLGFQMVSSKVHWTSDYPIALLMGYVMGKNAANRRIEKVKSVEIGGTKIPYKTNYTISNIDGLPVMGLTISF